MSKSLLNQIKLTVEDLTSDIKFKKKLGIAQYILDSIENDLAKLELNDPHFADGPQGYIDYYSPYAEEQIANKQKLLEKYIENLNLLAAVLVCINKKISEGRYLNQNKENEPQVNNTLRDLKIQIQELINIKDPSQLLQREDIKTEILRLKEINGARQELKEIETELKLIENVFELDEEEVDVEDREELKDDRAIRESRKIVLQDTIKPYEENILKVDGLKRVINQQDRIQNKLDKHIRLATEIPEGMLDVKRALSFQGELKVIQQKIQVKTERLNSLSANDPETQSIKNQIDLLVEKEKKILSIKFSATDSEDREIKERLEELRALMSSSIKGYQELAVSGGDLNAFLHKTTGFYWENLYLYRKTLSAFNKYLEDATDLIPEGQLVAQCIDNALNEAPPKNVINNALLRVKKVDKNLSKRESKYNEYARDNFEWDSDSNSDSDDEDDKVPIRFYKGAAVSITETVLAEQPAPFFLIPYNSRSYVLDHPAGSDLADSLGNCYGETQMFLYRINGKNPTFNNICPQTELLNLQLEQSRSLGTAESKVIGTFEANKEAKERVTWNTIKDFLTQEVDSPKHGDICWMKLTGASVPGHAKPVSHAIGFIKFKNPTPYKYVVYDYSLGAMGFSNEEQLRVFFKKLFEGEGSLYPYSKCVLNKIGEVSDECQKFFNGPAGVKPLEKADPSKTCERTYWNKQRLMLLLKYSKGSSQDITLVLGQLKQLNQDEKGEIYQAILELNKMGINNLLKLAIKTENLELLNFILKQDYSIRSDISYFSSKLLSPIITKHLVNCIMAGEITSELAYFVFDTNLTKQIVQLVCQGDLNSDLVFKLFGTEKIEEAALDLLRNREIDTELVCKTFNNNKAILLAGIKRNTGYISHASEALLNDKDFFRSAVKEMPSLIYYANDNLKNDKGYISELLKLFPQIMTYLPYLKNNKEFILELVKSTPEVLNFIRANLKNNRNFILDAVKINAKALSCTRFNDNRMFILEAIRENQDILNCVDDTFKKSDLYRKLLESLHNQKLVPFINELLQKEVPNKYHILIKNPEHKKTNRFHLFTVKYKDLASDIGKQQILEEFKERLQTYKNVDDAFQSIDDLKEKVQFLSTGQGLLTKMFDWETDSITALKSMIAEFGEKPDKLWDIVNRSSIKDFKK